MNRPNTNDKYQFHLYIGIFYATQGRSVSLSTGYRKNY